MRVLVCRARPDAVATARALAEAGHEALIAPVLDIVGLPASMPGGRFDAVLMSSHQAAEVLDPAMSEALRHLPLYAVGARTAAAARLRGFSDIRVADGDAASLADLVALTAGPRRRLLYLVGHHRKPDLEAGLGGRGHGVVTIEIYEARPAPPWQADVVAALTAGRVGACLHFSRRSAELAIRQAVRAGLLPQFATLRHACLSADVAQPLRGAAIASVAVATHPEQDALIDLIRLQ